MINHKNSNKSKTPSVNICGVHSVLAALRSRHCYHLYVTENFLKSVDKIFYTLIKQHQNLILETVEVKRLNQILGTDLAHQGCILQAQCTKNYDLNIFLKELGENSKAHVVILDQITDGHNLGSIVRTCSAFNVNAIIIPQDKACNFNNQSAIKSACGGMEHIKLITVVNIRATMDKLKENGFWCVGFDEKSNTELSKCKKLDFKRLSLIFGAEGRGIRSLNLKSCDLVCKISTNPNFPTLNVSNALAAVVHYLSYEE